MRRGHHPVDILGPVADPGGFGIDVEADQPHRYLDRRLVGHAPFDALGNGILGLAERITDKLKGTEPVEIGDRENRLECLVLG